MPSQPNDSQQRPHIEHSPDAPAHTAADELLSHGLLGFLHLDKPAEQERRVTRVLDAIEAESSHSHPVVYKLTHWRTWGALAATIAVIAALAIYGVPGETSGLATVQKSIAAMQQGPGDRRFEIRTQGWNETEVAAEVRGMVDTRSPNLMLMKIPAFENRTVIVGSDESGRWAIRLDGQVERTRVEQAWPRFATIGDESLFADSIDKILEQAARFYDLSRQPSEKLDGHGDRALEHVRGIKKNNRPGPATIDIWISPDSRIAERLQLTFDPAPPTADRAGDRPGPRRRPGAGPDGDGPQDQPDNDPRGDRRPRGPRPNGPRPEGDGPRGERPDNGNPPPDDAGPPDDRGPRDDMDDDHPHPRGGPGPQFAPGGIPLPPGGPRFRPDGPGPGGPPGGPDGGDGPRGQRAPKGPPHKVLRLDRVDPPQFTPDWFKPETHTSK